MMLPHPVRAWLVSLPPKYGTSPDLESLPSASTITVGLLERLAGVSRDFGVDRDQREDELVGRQVGRGDIPVLGVV